MSDFTQWGWALFLILIPLALVALAFWGAVMLARMAGISGWWGVSILPVVWGGLLWLRNYLNSQPWQ